MRTRSAKANTPSILASLLAGKSGLPLLPAGAIFLCLFFYPLYQYYPRKMVRGKPSYHEVASLPLTIVKLRGIDINLFLFLS
jgi:hypothetical protein